MIGDQDQPAEPASPPCYADAVGQAGTDTMTVEDRDKWRRSTRKDLIASRSAVAEDDKVSANMAIAGHLENMVQQRFAGAEGLIVAVYWPINGEPDLRAWMQTLVTKGIGVALPVVAGPDLPLTFLSWSPDTAMRDGRFNIPEPVGDHVVSPDIIVAPTVGWDRARFRLGYGGGFYDRTIAAMTRRPYVIGVGLDTARLETIYPQPHDIPMDVIVTETGLQG